jgi:hypothetical protein
MIEKIVRADKVIHEQQLNIGWDMPNDPIFTFLKTKQGSPVKDGSSNNQNTQGNSFI